MDHAEEEMVSCPLFAFACLPALLACCSYDDVRARVIIHNCCLSLHVTPKKRVIERLIIMENERWMNERTKKAFFFFIIILRVLRRS